MRRRSVGVALLSLGLLLPATASAKPSAREQAALDTYKVLVVTSTQDALSAAGIAAIRTAVESPTVTVTAPAPADVGAQFTPANLDTYRAVVFLNTGIASPLTDPQRANFEAYFRKGGSFVGIGSAVETDPTWQFLTDILGTRSSGRTDVQSGTVKVYDRVHDATKGLPEYWDRTDNWYNFSTNVRGVSHVLDTVVEDPFGPQPQGQTLDGIAGGTMGADHPISWCKDYQGGRSFYMGLGNTVDSYDAGLRSHLKGAISWAAGASDPVYSDCGATVLKNYQQVKVSAPPNLLEPIGFDQLPDGRIIQTSRTGTVRLHDPVKGTTTILADFSSASLPTTMRLYTNQEDGLYGPGLDNNFATDHWVYLYYAPQTVTNVKLSDGSIVTQTTPNTTPPNAAASLSAWDPYVGYFQLSRFKFVDDGVNPPFLDLNSEQQILRVNNNRQECCHVAGDIDFDKNNNLWMTTGDDTPAAGIDANGYGPFEDQLLDEQQTVRTTNATGGTFTLTFNGQTTAPLPFNATAAQVDTALEALSNVGADNIQTSGGPANTANVNVFFRRALQQTNQNQITADGSALTGTGPTVTTATAQEGAWYQRPTGDDRRSTLNTNDLRGKLLRIHVKDTITPADFNHADLGSGGAYTIPSGNLFPLVAGAPQAKTRPEVYAMGFRNPFRLQVDENDVAYVTDYSPDASTPARSRGPSGVGRVEIVRHPANYGYPICYSSKLGYYRWNFREFAPNTTTVGTPLDNPPQPIDCGANPLVNDSRWVRDGGPGFEPGLRDVPPVTDPDIWYSYRDNNAATPLGTPCFGYYATTPGAIAPGSTTECPRLFPELFTGGVGPHGAAKYHYDPANPSTTKFPPYYDNSVIFGEFTQDTLREVKLDSQNRILKINSFLPCGQANVPNPVFTFECDNPMDMQWGKDGSFYLLTYGDGFFAANPDAGMYRWDYVKGQRAPKAVLNADRTDGPAPLTVNFSSAGSLDDDPGDSIRFEWDFGDGSAISTEANPSHTYTQAGRYTAVLTRVRLLREEGRDEHDHHGGQHQPDRRGDRAARRRDVLVRRHDPVQGDRHRSGGPVDQLQRRHGDVRARPRHARPRRAELDRLHRVPADRSPTTSRTAATCSASSARPTPTRAAPAGRLRRCRRPARSRSARSTRRSSSSSTSRAPTRRPTPTAATASIAAACRPVTGSSSTVRSTCSRSTRSSFRVADAAAGRTAGSPLAAIEVRQDSITGPILTTANLVSTGGTAVWSTQSFPIAMTGKHELFFVFRAVTGGATGGNLFNLNWAEFGGNGVTVVQTNAPGTVGGSVPATLALSLGTPAAFGPFTPGVAKTYAASTTANVISTAGDATLTVADPSSTATGHLVNGTFSLPSALTAKAASAAGTGGAFAAVGGSSSPTSLLTYAAPASNDAVTLSFQQAIGATDALRTGSYSKTLTFTLSTTTP